MGLEKMKPRSPVRENGEFNQTEASSMIQAEETVQVPRQKLEEIIRELERLAEDVREIRKTRVL